MSLCEEYDFRNECKPEKNPSQYKDDDNEAYVASSHLHIDGRKDPLIELTRRSQKQTWRATGCAIFFYKNDIVMSNGI